MIDRFIERIASSISDRTRHAVRQLIVYGCLLFLSGTFSSLLGLYMSETMSPKCAGCKPTPFDSVTVILVIQCIGEVTCIFAYWALRMLVSSNLLERQTIEFDIGNPNLPRARWHHWIYIGLTDTTSVFLIFVAQAYLTTFTVQMIRCSSLFLSAVGCIIAFRRNIRVSSWVGLLFICLGQVLASIDTTKSSSSAAAVSSSDGATMGLASIILGTIAASMFYVFEERMWIKYSFNPLEGVGHYGITAFLGALLVTLVADKIGWEIWRDSVHQILSSKRLFILSALYLPVVGTLNFAALCATGVGSALFTATILAARPICTWIFGLFREAKSHRGTLSIVGMCLITLGLLFYMGLVGRLLPARIKRKLDSDLQMQCFLLWDDDEFQDDESLVELDESSSESVRSGASSVDEHPDKHACEKSFIPNILGEINITKCPDDFYQHIPDDEWIVIDKEVEISLPQADNISTTSTQPKET